MLTMKQAFPVRGLRTETPAVRGRCTPPDGRDFIGTLALHAMRVPSPLAHCLSVPSAGAAWRETVQVIPTQGRIAMREMINHYWQ